MLLALAVAQARPPPDTWYADGPRVRHYRITARLCLVCTERDGRAGHWHDQASCTRTGPWQCVVFILSMPTLYLDR